MVVRWCSSRISPSGASRIASGLTAALVMLTGVLTTVMIGGITSPADAHSRFATDPLTVTIDVLTPSVIPTSGALTVQGTISNSSTDTWDNIGMYPLTSYDPLTTSQELAQAARADPADPVGDRITALGPLDTIDSLAPGQTVSFAMRIPRRVISIRGTSGVYWFGVQALGEVGGVREEVAIADGRARTFLPYVAPTGGTAKKPTGATGEVRTALVLPLRQDLTMQADGRVDGVADWVENLGPDGRLRRLIDFGATAGSRPLTWLIDPAVPDAAASIANGNLPFDLSSTEPPEGEPEPSGSPSPTDGTTDGSSDGASESPSGDDEPDLPNAPEPPELGATPEQSAVAKDWMDSLTATLSDVGASGVLALPYGDLDVAATAVRAPELVGSARTRATAALERLELAARPAIAPPGGSLPSTVYPVVDPDETILVTPRTFAEEPPERADVDGRILTNAPYVADGPAPSDPKSLLAMRQMILSEAAVRLLSDETATHAMVVQFPTLWEGPTDEQSATSFFAGLDGLSWFSLSELANATTDLPSPVQPGDLVYPARQLERQLPGETIIASQALIAAGNSLQTTLTRNDQVADRVLDVALTTVSYADRNAPRTARVIADRNRAWISDQLGEITITAPVSLTLSSSTGPLPATVTNGMDYPVTVRIEGRGDSAVTITGPKQVRLAPGERGAVNLKVAADTLGVHNVQLVVTDVDGVPLGGSVALPVRSAPVGKVIWVILAVGVALLFSAIAVRLFRRIRASRSGDSS